MEPLDLQRYQEKLVCEGIHLPDPRCVPDDDWKDDLSQLPKITFPDIYVYLINSKGKYTSENLKAYKSLSSWDLFKSGHVGKLEVHKPSTSLRFMRTKVRASQKVSASYETWVLCHADGSVKSAHCMCKAGLGEVCSHIAASLFKAQTAVMLGLTEKSCTSKACEWNCQFQKKVEPSTMTSISKKAGLKTRPMRAECHLSNECMQQELTKLTAIHDCTLASSLPDEARPGSQGKELPFPLHKTMMMLKKQVEPGQALSPEYSRQFLAKLPGMYTDQVLKNLEEATVSQSQSAVWKSHRHGRLTASVFGEVVHHMRGGKKSRTLVNKVICPPKPLRTEAVLWGNAHEEAARMAAEEALQPLHMGLKVRKVGLFVCNEAPYLAASPDGILSCHCCGDSLLEVKCPFSVRNGEPTEAAFLDENRMLRDDHVYMYQVQGQMMVTGMKCAYFCVFVPGHVPHILRIQRDEDQIRLMRKELELYYVREVMPALIC